MHRRGRVAEHLFSKPNETESKMQTLNTQSSSLKVVRQTYLPSADAAYAPVRSLILKWADN